jgi:hypothetical protein
MRRSHPQNDFKAVQYRSRVITVLLGYGGWRFVELGVVSAWVRNVSNLPSHRTGALTIHLARCPSRNSSTDFSVNQRNNDNGPRRRLRLAGTDRLVRYSQSACMWRPSGGMPRGNSPRPRFVSIVGRNKSDNELTTTPLVPMIRPANCIRTCHDLVASSTP